MNAHETMQQLNTKNSFWEKLVLRGSMFFMEQSIEQSFRILLYSVTLKILAHYLDLSSFRLLRLTSQVT